MSGVNSAGLSPERSREPFLRLRDNPLLVAQARRRLRLRKTVPGLAIVLLLGICGALFAASTSRPEKAWIGVEVVALLGLGYLLFVRGLIRVGATIATEHKAGLVDFHRATPTTPWTDALGYLLGIPAREYALALAILPFLAISSLGAGHSFGDLVSVVLLFLLSSVLYSSLALAVGLVYTRPWRAAAVPVIIVMALFFTGSAFHEVGLSAFGYLTPYPAIAALQGHGSLLQGAAVPVSFFAVPVPALLFAVVLQGYLLFFLLWAVVRRLRARSAPLFSRPGAIVFVAIAVLLLDGTLWNGAGIWGDRFALSDVETAVLALLMLATSTGVASLLLLVISPTYLGVLRAVRRARHAGRSWPHWLADNGASWPIALVFGGIVGLGLLVLSAGMAHQMDATKVFGIATFVAIAGVAAFLAYVATASEWVRLGARRAQRNVGLLVAFLSLVLPWILAGIVSMPRGELGGQVGPWLAAFSPTYVVVFSFVWLSAQWSSDLAALQVQQHLGSLALSFVVTLGLVVFFGGLAARIRRGLSQNT